MRGVLLVEVDSRAKTLLFDADESQLQLKAFDVELAHASLICEGNSNSYCD